MRAIQVFGKANAWCQVARVPGYGVIFAKRWFVLVLHERIGQGCWCTSRTTATTPILLNLLFNSLSFDVPTLKI